jgi:ribonuclease HII
MEANKGQREADLIKNGQHPIGIDEVGRGCLAGPVYAAAVALNYDKLHALDPKYKKLIRDSKTLSAKQRQSILEPIRSIAIEYAIAQSRVREIEALGIVPATFLAMARAQQGLQGRYDLVLIDGNQTNPQLTLPQEPIIGGDGLVFAIAAASILAKEERDACMRLADQDYPGYGFADHVGYGTKSHLTALAAHGITPLHRRNFAPISRYVEQHGQLGTPG